MSKRLEILEKINSGEISAEEGALELAKLSKLEEHAGEDHSEVSEQMKVLEMIEKGEISASDGAVRLRGDEGKDSPPADDAPDAHVDVEILSSTAPTGMPSSFRKWENWWLMPFGFGLAVVVMAGMWMNSIYENANGTNFWFYCAWVPMLMGLGVAFVGWASRNSPWVHVRVDSDNTKVRVSLPIPLGFTGWGLRTFGHYIPNIDSTSLDEILMSLDKTTRGETPLHVQVDQGAGGEKVEVFIG